MSDSRTMSFLDFEIQLVDRSIEQLLQQKIDNKTKPPGSLGYLEEIALQIGCIQNTLEPKLLNPTLVVFAGDHGISRENIVNRYPQEVTAQMVYNFLNEGAAINVFCRQNNLALKIVDAGVNHHFSPHHKLILAKIEKGTRNYTEEPAMSTAQCQKAMILGSEIVDTICQSGSNVLGFGEMGIGNTSSAALIMHLLTGIPLEDCVGRGAGLDEEGVVQKLRMLKKVVTSRPPLDSVMDHLAYFGGFEIVMMCGAMLRAASLKMTLMIDGFITTTALLAASKINERILPYCLFTHQSAEKGHQLLLAHMGARPILSLDMRLGEGTGAAVCYPLIRSAVNFLNEMASFDEARITNPDSESQ